MNRNELEAFLSGKGITYELLAQERPILSAQDAAGYYPVEQSAPTFVLQTENGLIGCIVSYQNGRLALEQLKQRFGFQKLKMAGREKIKAQTGYDVGAVPLVGLGLPCLLDAKLLRHEAVYGGTGDPLLTLKIAPAGLWKANDVLGTFD